MGLTPDTFEFLLAMRARGLSIERTMTLGRQGIFHIPVDGVVDIAAEYGEQISTSEARSLVKPGGSYQGVSAEPLLRRLGAQEIRSIDASRFEGCTDVHDLNVPVPTELDSRFSAVLDFGTLEHVWNVPVALLNSMRMVRPGGDLVITTPINNQPGHGLYQFGPDLFFRALSIDNGFEVRFAGLREGLRRAPWYSIQDPAGLGRRVTFVNSVPTMMYLCASRIADKLPEVLAVYQSDYEATWKSFDADAAPHVGSRGGSRRLTHSFARVVPRVVKDMWHDTVRARWDASRGLGADAEAIRRVDLRQLGT